jgi:hypothetical protein
MMKMVQEVRGFAEITSRRPHTRPPGPALLTARSPSPRNSAKRRRTLSITIQDPPDIPHPVSIVHLKKP